MVNTEDIWNKYYTELYLYVLKRVGNTSTVKEIIQNTFVKVHLYIDSLKTNAKAKAWVFTIAKNEIINYYRQENKHKLLETSLLETEHVQHAVIHFCCFDKFLNELPEQYQSVMTLVYVKGKKQNEAAEMLNLSLANVKARVRRAKELLKQRFVACCKYKVNKTDGKLYGEPKCACCS